MTHRGKGDERDEKHGRERGKEEAREEIRNAQMMSRWDFRPNSRVPLSPRTISPSPRGARGQHSQHRQRRPLLLPAACLMSAASAVHQNLSTCSRGLNVEPLHQSNCSL